MEWNYFYICIYFMINSNWNDKDSNNIKNNKIFKNDICLWFFNNILYVYIFNPIILHECQLSIFIILVHQSYHQYDSNYFLNFTNYCFDFNFGQNYKLCKLLRNYQT